MTGALAAIRVAREWRIPFLGTCGGFQHVVIEYARNVLGHTGADHAESNPAAALALVTPLACALVEARGRIRLAMDSLTAQACGCSEIEEEFNCRYGFNEQHRDMFANSVLRITGTDEHGAMRILELNGHPFFVATLFQPERRALRGEAHPLVSAFLAAAASARRLIDPADVSSG
jgi:CTP synthase (UTP-ammonia lyase)